MPKALMLLTLLFIPSCGGDREPASPHETATIERADSASSSEAAPADVAGEEAADSSTACSPPCGADQVCCTDQHGHFPRCVSGSTCP